VIYPEIQIKRGHFERERNIQQAIDKTIGKIANGRNRNA
jgi:hypothetical protein